MKIKLTILSFISIAFFHPALANTCATPALETWRIDGENVNAGDLFELTIGGYKITHTTNSYTKSADIWPHYLIMAINQKVPSKYAQGEHKEDLDTYDPVTDVFPIVDDIRVFAPTVPVSLTKNGVDYTSWVILLDEVEQRDAFTQMHIPYFIKGADDTSYQTEIFISLASEIKVDVSVSLYPENQQQVGPSYDEYSEVGDNISYSGAFNETNNPLISATLDHTQTNGTIILNPVGTVAKMYGSILIRSETCSDSSVAISVTRKSTSPDGDTKIETNYIAGGRPIPLL